MSSDLDLLKLRTTEAIFRADALTDLHAPGAAAAHREVSLFEEQIAERTVASKPEGAIARRGAVGAAVLAGDDARAEELIARFSADEGAGETLYQELTDVVAHVTALRTEERRKVIAKGFPRAAARYDDAEEIVYLAEAIARQAEPLPIS